MDIYDRIEGQRIELKSLIDEFEYKLINAKHVLDTVSILRDVTNVFPSSKIYGDYREELLELLQNSYSEYEFTFDSELVARYRNGSIHLQRDKNYYVFAPSIYKEDKSGDIKRICEMYLAICKFEKNKNTKTLKHLVEQSQVDKKFRWLKIPHALSLVSAEFKKELKAECKDSIRYYRNYLKRLECNAEARKAFFENNRLLDDLKSNGWSA